LRLLGPGGAILYATCSLEPEENREQAEWLRHWHGLEIETERVTEPSGLPGETLAGYHDGSYAALMRRPGARSTA
ncbi:MAG: 16S rRNA (cytosine(967)-C(5))-methyltransferase, partial [Planctomycetota bacterium]